MDLHVLNQRWQTVDHPHAAPAEVEGKFRPHCPSCGYTGRIDLPLIAAMNDAIAHKNTCEHWRGGIVAPAGRGC